MSLELARRDFDVTGKKASPVTGSRQRTSSIAVLPEMVSSSPASASGVNMRDSAGFRRSQSTSTARPPPWVISVASDSATVDLPSLGSADVTPMVLLTFATLVSAATFTARIDSLKRENGELVTVQ